MTRKQAAIKAIQSRNLLFEYRRQLLARHKTAPLKSPPLFLLDTVLHGLDTLAKGLR